MQPQEPSLTASSNSLKPERAEREIVTKAIRRKVPISSLAKGSSATYSYASSLQSGTNALSIFHWDSLAVSIQEECLFLRRGDYWFICYASNVAFLKATRGLQCLSLLLRHPGREFHVCELRGEIIETRFGFATGRHSGDFWQDGLLSDAGPVLDASAKAEYKRRLDELRRDLEEAERFNDLTRAERARSEMNALAEQLASAVGLGGRDRKMS